MFWNRIGSPSSVGAETTATVEEFERAVKQNKAWVYFKRPTETVGTQLEGVLNFRRKLESGKQIFFREFTDLADWEEMFREHLVAYLDGLKRLDIDNYLISMNPAESLMKGNFLCEGTYTSGTRMTLRTDLDGDGRDEEIRFFLSHGAYSLILEKDGRASRLPLPDSLSHLNFIDRIHLAVKDVTNDGLPEIILAFAVDRFEVFVAVFGSKDTEGRERRLETFEQLGQFQGQTLWPVLIYEGGTIVLRYGTAGCAWVARWSGREFITSDEIVAQM